MFPSNDESPLHSSIQVARWYRCPGRVSAVGYLQGKSLPDTCPALRLMLTSYSQAMTFNAAIKQIDTCRIYHSGPNYFVEIDIVMDGDMPLWRAHDIAQDLQDQIEKLPDVDRCFVHIDHETDHKPVSRFQL